MRLLMSVLSLSALSLSACSKSDPVDPAADMVAPASVATGTTSTAAVSVTTDLFGPDKTPLGKVTASDSPGGLMLTLAGVALPAGTHGFHFHAIGRCEGPKFDSAGGHWNPGNKKHGLESPAGPHRGDLPNLTVADGGALNQLVTVQGVTLTELKDGDGTALVIHASADDNKTDPSGNSGDRIACAILAPAR